MCKKLRARFSLKTLSHKNQGVKPDQESKRPSGADVSVPQAGAEDQQGGELLEGEDRAEMAAIRTEFSPEEAERSEEEDDYEVGGWIPRI